VPTIGSPENSFRLARVDRPMLLLRLAAGHSTAGFMDLRPWPSLRDDVPMSLSQTSSPTTLFRLLSEFILLLLGALLVLLALTRRVGLPTRPAALIFLGVLFLYWGIRTGMRCEPGSVRAQGYLRAGSLVLVGLLVLGIPLLPLRHANLLLGIAGGVLVLRGIVSALLSLEKA
jgi:hypothetical protein